jgi:Asp-tRNA(Asn)/Glu-tRNA(Gln) amidotransferase C subunit
MAAEPRVTKQAVEHMARDVIGIDLSPAEIDQLTPQLDKLLTDLAQIPDADLQDIEPPLFFHADEPEQA